MPHLATRVSTTAGVVLVGASIIAGTPVTGPVAGAHTFDVRLTAEEITLDLVRHGLSYVDIEASPPHSEIPGLGLTPTGVEQAEAVAPKIQEEFGNSIAGIYASNMLRTQETAEPLATLLGMHVTDLGGLDEIDAGIFDGLAPTKTMEELFILSPLLWALGFPSTPLLGSSDYNGMAFDARYSDAVQTIYNNTISDGDGKLTDIAFTHGGAMTIWTLMNVKNPDFSVILSQSIPNTAQVVIKGDPTDGWTLESWNGVAVPQNPGLPTELFVDFRNLIAAPQFAEYTIQEGLLQAVANNDPQAFTTAVEHAFQQVSAALVQFPQAIFNDIAGALGDGGA